MRRTIFERLTYFPFYYRTTTNEIWKALTSLELKLTNTSVSIPKNIDYSKYSQDLVKPHFHHTKFLDSFMTQFFNSKPIEGLVHGQQMMLVSGPDRIGKTTFIKNSLQKIRQGKAGKNITTPIGSYEILPEKVYQTANQTRILDSNSETLIIEIDFQNNRNLTFNAFIDHIQKELTKHITKTIEEFSINKKVLITQHILLKLMLLKSHPSFIRTYAKDTLKQKIEELGDSNVLAQKLQKVKIFSNNSTEVISEEQLLKQLNQIVLILKQNNDRSVIENSIHFYLEILKQIEYQYRPAQYSNSYYRTGIETTGFLLSILDYFVGTVELTQDKLFIRPKHEVRSNEFVPESQNQNVFFHKTDHEIVDNSGQIPQSILKRKSMLKQIPQPTTCIEAGEHIDTVLAFLNIFQTACSKDKEFLDWYDALIMRSINISGLRKGVPIIMELDPSTRVQDIFNQGALPPNNPLIVDLAGYRVYKDKEVMFKIDIESYQFYKIWSTLGHHPEMWKDAIIELEKKGKHLHDVISEMKNLEITKRDCLIAQALFNRVFTNPKSVELMHKPEFRYQLINLLKVIKKNRIVDVVNTHAKIKLVDNNWIMKIILESGLLTSAYYQFYVTATRSSYIHAIPKIIDSLKNNHALSYALWYLKNGYYFPDHHVKYRYEIVVHFSLIRPRTWIKQQYYRVPMTVMQNKVMLEAYIPQQDTDSYFSGASSVFYKR